MKVSKLFNILFLNAFLFIFVSCETPVEEIEADRNALSATDDSEAVISKSEEQPPAKEAEEVDEININDLAEENAPVESPAPSGGSTNNPVFKVYSFSQAYKGWTLHVSFPCKIQYSYTYKSGVTKTRISDGFCGTTVLPPAGFNSLNIRDKANCSAALNSIEIENHVQQGINKFKDKNKKSTSRQYLFANSLRSGDAGVECSMHHYAEEFGVRWQIRDENLGQFAQDCRPHQPIVVDGGTSSVVDDKSFALGTQKIHPNSPGSVSPDRYVTSGLSHNLLISASGRTPLLASIKDVRTTESDCYRTGLTSVCEYDVADGSRKKYSCRTLSESSSEMILSNARR